MLVSISEGFCLDGLLGAILLRAACDMIAVVCEVVEVEGSKIGVVAVGD